MSNQEKRYQYNQLLLKLLSQYIEANPDMRFGQILHNFGFIQPNDYYMESSDLYQIVLKGERLINECESIRVADYLVEIEAAYIIDKHDNAIDVESVWVKETHEVGLEPTDSVFVIGSAREQE